MKERRDEEGGEGGGRQGSEARKGHLPWGQVADGSALQPQPSDPDGTPQSGGYCTYWVLGGAL